MSFWSSVKSMGNLVFGANKYEGNNSWDKSMGRFNDLKAKGVDGNDVDFSQFDGSVLLITNVACKCGYTKSSYTEMEKLSVKYGNKGLRILCFPCNQFMGQEPWNEEEITKWVTGKWPKLNPTMFAKIEVNGDNTHNVYKFLKKCFPGDINWNFSTKFVVGKNGIPSQRFDKSQTWDDIEKFIQNELKKDYQPQAKSNEVQKEEKEEKEKEKEQEKEKVAAQEKNEEKQQEIENDKLSKEIAKIDKKISNLQLNKNENDDTKQIQSSIKSLQSNDEKINKQINELQSKLDQYESKLSNKNDNQEL